jgi:hypothetical protein
VPDVDHLNRGHGHVFPRPDGKVARCGGPAICSVCAGDLARKNAMEQHPSAPPEAKGYVVATDALERLERLVAVISEPLVAFTAELSGERDAAVERARQAEALNGRLTKALAYMVDQYPTTSWGGANDARDAAQGLLREIEQEGATMGSEPSPPADQETDTHGPTPHRDPDRSGD